MKEKTNKNNFLNLLSIEQKKKYKSLIIPEELKQEIQQQLKSAKNFPKRLEIIVDNLENIFNSLNGKKLLSYKQFKQQKQKEKRLRKSKKILKNRKSWKR